MADSTPAPGAAEERTQAAIEAWRSAPVQDRVTLLERLLQPLGPLARLAVASGAFSAYFAREHWGQVHVRLEDAARFSAEQVLELARFAIDVQPESLQSLALGPVPSQAGVVGLVTLATALLVAVWRR